MFQMWIRNPNMLVAELAQYLFMAIFMVRGSRARKNERLKWDLHPWEGQHSE